MEVVGTHKVRHGRTAPARLTIQLSNHMETPTHTAPPVALHRLVHPLTDHGGVSIYLGDCLDIMPQLENDSFDAVVTDPPYSSGGRTQAAARNVVSKSDSREADEWFMGDNMGVDTYIRWMRQIARESLRVVIQGGHAYVFTDWRQFTNLSTAWESVGWSLRSVIVWDKAKGGAMGSFWRNNHEWCCVFTKGQPNPPAHRSCFNTWTGSKPQGHEHPTEKPLGLMTYIIGAIPKSTGKILEPFAGSGTTLEAAKLCGFGAVGIERNPVYAKACAAKISQGTLAL